MTLRPFPESLCHRCSAVRYVETRTSTFILCQTLSNKYPRQPVQVCAGFVSRADESAQGSEAAAEESPRRPPE